MFRDDAFSLSLRAESEDFLPDGSFCQAPNAGIEKRIGIVNTDRSRGLQQRGDNVRIYEGWGIT